MYAAAHRQRLDDTQTVGAAESFALLQAGRQQCSAACQSLALVSCELHKLMQAQAAAGRPGSAHGQALRPRWVEGSWGFHFSCREPES